MENVTRQCPQTTTFEEKGESKRYRTEVLPLTSLTARPNRLTALYIVCIFCIIMLEQLSIKDKYKKSDKIFHLDVHYVCMLVQLFEPQGRHFTN